MSDKNRVYFSFPPTGIGISSSEYRNLTLDLPHLCLNTKPKYQVVSGDETKYTIVKGDNVKQYSKSSLDIFKNKDYRPEFDYNKWKQTTKLPEETKQVKYHKANYIDLIKPNSWMCDETVSILVNWIECIKDDESQKRLHVVSSIATQVLINRFRQYQLNCNASSEDQNLDEMKATVDKFRRVLRIHQNQTKESDCIFMIVNIPNQHWCLVCLCNLRTIETNFIDFEDSDEKQKSSEGLNEEDFLEYSPPCILIFDSMCKTGKAEECVETLISGLRFWLTNDRTINPNGYKFSSQNLPATVIQTIQQKDGSSCGYFAIRNIIGMFISSKEIFPIHIKDLVKSTNQQKFKKSIHAIFKKGGIKKVSVINNQRSMMYTHDSVAEALRGEIRMLFERLRDIYVYCKGLRNTIIQAVKKKVDETTSIKSIVNSIESIKLNSKVNRDNIMINIEKKYNEEMARDAQHFFLIEDDKVPKLTGECQCPGPTNDDLKKSDPHRLPDITFQCFRTKKENTGFDFDVKKEGALERGMNELKFTDQYLRRIANGCSIGRSPQSPDSGDCGYHLLARILSFYPDLWTFQSSVRLELGHDLLTPKELSGGGDVKKRLKKFDMSFYLKCLHAQTIKDDIMTLNDLTVKQTILMELKEIFDENHKPKWDQIKDIDVEGRWILHRKRSKAYKGRDKGWTKKEDYFEFIDRNNLNDINTRIVMGYLFKLCQSLEENQVERFHECCELYFSIPPKLIGSFGTPWLNADVLNWFETLWMVKIFICYPGVSSDQGFFATLTPDDGNLDFNDDSFKDTENNHHYFQQRAGSFRAYGLAVVIFSSNHYHSLLTKPNSQDPFFRVGEDLPDLIYKSCKIDPAFWKSLSEKDIIKTNRLEAHEQRCHRGTDRPVNPGTIVSHATKLHRKISEPKYSIEDMEKILFDGNVPTYTTNHKTSKIREEIGYQQFQGKFFCDFSLSLSDAFFTLVPSFLALRIFQSFYKDGHKLSNLVEKYNPKLHSLQGKHDHLVSFQAILSSDLKLIYSKDHICYTDFIENLKKENEAKYSSLRNDNEVVETGHKVPKYLAKDDSLNKSNKRAKLDDIDPVKESSIPIRSIMDKKRKADVDIKISQRKKKLKEDNQTTQKEGSIITQSQKMETPTSINKIKLKTNDSKISVEKSEQNTNKIQEKDSLEDKELPFRTDVISKEADQMEQEIIQKSVTQDNENSEADSYDKYQKEENDILDILGGKEDLSDEKTFHIQEDQMNAFSKLVSKDSTSDTTKQKNKVLIEKSEKEEGEIVENTDFDGAEQVKKNEEKKIDRKEKVEGIDQVKIDKKEKTIKKITENLSVVENTGFDRVEQVKKKQEKKIDQVNSIIDKEEKNNDKGIKDPKETIEKITEKSIVNKERVENQVANEKVEKESKSDNMATSIDKEVHIAKKTAEKPRENLDDVIVGEETKSLKKEVRKDEKEIEAKETNHNLVDTETDESDDNRKSSIKKKSKKISRKKKSCPYYKYISLEEKDQPFYYYCLVASIENFMSEKIHSELDSSVIKACQFSEEAIYQSRFIMSIIFNYFEEKKTMKKNKKKKKDVYIGVKDIDLWEMDDYYRVKMDEEKLKSLDRFFQEKKGMIQESIDLLEKSNIRSNHSHLIPRFVWAESGTQYCLFHSVFDSPYLSKIRNSITGDQFHNMMDDLTSVFFGITSEDKCGALGRSQHLLFCTHIGIVEPDIVKQRIMQWPEGAETYFDLENNIDIPLNTFSYSHFSVTCEDMIREKQDIEKKNKIKQSPTFKKKSKLYKKIGKQEEDEIKLRVKDYKYQFQIMMVHPSLEILGILMDIAVDALVKSSIFLLFVNQYKDPLKLIFEQKYLHRKDVFLFKNCFHSIKVFTSKSDVNQGPLYNSEDLLSVYMLFSQQSTFYVSLTNSLVVGNKPVIMKHGDIVVLTDEYPVEKLTVADSSTSYVLLKFSINKSFRDFLNVPNNANRMEKYIDFHSRHGLCDTLVEGKDPNERLKTIIIDRIRFTSKNKTNIIPNKHFQDHEFLMKMSIDLKYLYWEQMIKEAKHDQQIEKLQEKIKEIKNPKKIEVEKEDELKKLWDDVGYFSDEYKGSFDWVGYKRRSRRIRGLDVFFETKKDREDREVLQRDKEKRQKEYEEHKKRHIKYYQVTFNVTLGSPNEVVRIDKKTRRLIRRKSVGFVSINYSKTTGTKRSCIQDAIINVGDIFGLSFQKQKIYEIAPPSDYFDTALNTVMTNSYVSDRLRFLIVRFVGVKGGNEKLLYVNLRNQGGKYIVLCHIILDRNKKTEKHAFVFDADYKCDKAKVKGAIIDNQAHTKLTGIEDSDVKDVQSMRRVCHRLYGGKTFFTHCWLVLRK